MGILENININSSMVPLEPFEGVLSECKLDLGITDTSVSGINILWWSELMIKELMTLLKSVGFVPIIILNGSIRRKSCF